MKKLCATLVMASVVSVIGCGSSSTPGGPGATRSSSKVTTSLERFPGATTTETKKTDTSVKDDTFTLSVSNVKLKQGEEKTETIDIQRNKNFDEDVTLKFEGSPKGVTITPVAPMLAHGQPNMAIKIKADDTAALGKFTITVVGHPTRGLDATSTFTLTIDKI